jgi:hypothetical protein
MYPQNICSTDIKPDIPTGKVIAVARVNIIARRNSFQAKIKQRTPVATSPGVIIGNMIRQIAPK